MSTTYAPITRNHPNMVDLFYTTISSDTVLQNIFPGLQVLKYVDRQFLATTIKGGKGNAMLAISKTRTSPFEWNCGGQAGQQTQSVRIDIVARQLETPQAQVQSGSPPATACDIVEAIKRRVEDLLFTATYFGTGWLEHKELDDGYPSAPLVRLAYDRVIYSCLVSIGV